MGDNGVVLPQNKTIATAELPEFELDSFELSSRYRDPFLGKVFQEMKATRKYYNKPVVKAQEVEETPKPSVPFPDVKYSGSIFNKKLNQDVHMLELGGVFYQVKAPGVFGSIRVTKLYKDSLEVKFNDEIKVIHH